MAGANTTFVADQTAKLMRENAKGEQVGLRERYRELAKKLGKQHALDWLREHIEVTKQFRKLFTETDWGVADTEATGIGDADQICELAVIRGHDRKTLFSKLMSTTCPMQPGAVGQHGITAEMLRGEPTFADYQDEINEGMSGLSRVLWYNGAFDIRMKAQTSWIQGVTPEPEWPEFVEIMHAVAVWCGSWNARKNGWRWPKLEGGHRARGDCLYLIDHMTVMATSDIEYAQKLIIEETRT